MCRAKPGRRCSNDAFARYEKAKAAVENPSAGATGLERGYARTEYMLAAADYAATFPRENPGLHAAANIVRDEQVALMPTKPAINEPGHAEYQALANARDRLASAMSACRQAELAGKDADVTQMVFESAVFDVAQAEKAFRAVAWHHYDVTPAAHAELLDASESGDETRLERAKAVYYLSQHHTWPEEAQARYQAALASNDEPTIDAAWHERGLATYAVSQMPGLAAKAYPHSVLHREHPGERMPPAPWIGKGRQVEAIDTAQIRYLCEGSATQTRWSNKDQCVYVSSLNGSTQQRLWAYGYHTEDTEHPGVVRVVRAPDVTERRQLPAASAAA